MADSTRMEVSMTEALDFPAGSVVEFAPTGVAAGVRLPSGELIKPWITWELADDEADEYTDLSHEHLELRGIQAGLEYEREISVVPQ